VQIDDPDPDKEQKNRQKHGLSLTLAAGMDLSTALIKIDDRCDYGETRFQALGMIGARLHMLIYTMRGPKLRPVSLRKANPRERKRYDQEA